MLDYILLFWVLPSLCTFLFILTVERLLGTPPTKHNVAAWIGITSASVVWPVGLLIESCNFIVEGNHTNIFTKERK